MGPAASLPLTLAERTGSQQSSCNGIGPQCVGRIQGVVEDVLAWPELQLEAGTEPAVLRVPGTLTAALASDAAPRQRHTRPAQKRTCCRATLTMGTFDPEQMNRDESPYYALWVYH